MTPAILKLIQYILATLSLATLVASDVLDWSLSDHVVGFLGALIGLAIKRPSDGVAGG